MTALEQPILKVHRLLSVFWSQSDQALERQLASAQDDSMSRNCLLQS